MSEAIALTENIEQIDLTEPKTETIKLYSDDDSDVDSENENDDMRDIVCPICKTSRYLSPDMKFLVNPECYHKICESCVDRIFTLGPTKCPYENCNKILRKLKFKRQIFDNIEIEKEIDVRNKVYKIMNKFLEDFETREDYDKFLEDREDVIFELSNLDSNNETQLEEVEKKLMKYEQMNKRLIQENNQKMKSQEMKQSDMESVQQTLQKERLALLKKMEEQNIEDNQSYKQKIIAELSKGTDKNKIIANVKMEIKLKKSSQRRKLEELNKVLKSNSYTHNHFNKMQDANEEFADVPFTPFNGDRELHKKYKVLEDYDFYYDPFISNLSKVPKYIANGFNEKNIYDKLLNEAFLGFGVFVEEEKKQAN
ncbi:hypothetical protein QEN19_000891 [Hanseniaspora menglaensis]